MTTLEDLARVLGGIIQNTPSQPWLDTTIGELRAVVTRGYGLISKMFVYDLAVFTSYARELDPLHPHSSENWRLDGQDVVLPRLRHGYVFAGCRAGVLFATSLSPPSLEHVVATLWELADWARKPWRPLTVNERIAGQAHDRRRRRQRLLSRVGFVASVVLLAALVRRLR